MAEKHAGKYDDIPHCIWTVTTDAQGQQVLSEVNKLARETFGFTPGIRWRKYCKHQLLLESETNSADGIECIIQDIHMDSIGWFSLRQIHDVVTATPRTLMAALCDKETLHCVRHELNTPLQTIMGASSLLLSEPMKEQHLRLVKLMNMAALDCSSVVEGLVHLISEVNSEPMPSIFSLSSFLGQILLDIRPFSRERGVDVLVAKKSNDVVDTDIVRIRWLLVNLLRAIISSWGHMNNKINTIHLSFSKQNTDGKIMLQLDSSIPYHINVDEAKRSVEVCHVDIAMSIAMKITNRLLHALKVQVMQNSPCSLSLNIPIQIHNDTEVSSDSDDGKRGQDNSIPQNILLAEDNPINRRLLRKILHAIGLRNVVTVNDGQEAWNCYSAMRLTHKAFDLILLDRNMPFMTGDEVCVRIKEQDPTQVVYAISADISLPNPFDKSICKPVTKDSLEKFLFG